jgi:hypothetical protein
MAIVATIEPAPEKPAAGFSMSGFQHAKLPTRQVPNLKFPNPELPIGRRRAFTAPVSSYVGVDARGVLIAPPSEPSSLAGARERVDRGVG